MQFKVLDIFNMKRIITAFACLVVLGVQAQKNRAEYAAKLSSEYRFAEALPVWEELSTIELKKPQGDLGVLRKTVHAAFMSEAYDKAAYWSQKLTKTTDSDQDWVVYMNALKYLNQGARVSQLLDSALMKFPSSERLNGLKKSAPIFQSNLTDSSDYQIRMYHEGNGGEVYGAFPNPKGGILFVSNEYNHAAINRNYPRTGQFYSDIAVFDSVEATKKYKFYQKQFWIDFIYKNQWRDYDKTRAHDGPVSFNPDNSMMFVTTNYNEKDKEEGKFYLDLSFNGYMYDTEIKNFFRVIESLDNFIVNFIDNYQDCLGITIKNGYKYNHQLRYNKNNPKYPPTLKLKIFEKNTKIVDLYGKDVNNFAEYIQPNAKVQALIRCNGLWCYDNKWGLSWKVCKLVVKHPDFLPEYAFIDNSLIDTVTSINNTDEENDIN